MAQWINVVHGKRITRHKQIVYYKEQNGQSPQCSGCITAAVQVYIYNVECPKGQPSLVRNSSGQVNDTADNIIPFPVVEREQSQ